MKLSLYVVYYNIYTLFIYLFKTVNMMKLWHYEAKGAY